MDYELCGLGARLRRLGPHQAAPTNPQSDGNFKSISSLRKRFTFMFHFPFCVARVVCLAVCWVVFALAFLWSSRNPTYFRRVATSEHIIACTNLTHVYSPSRIDAVCKGGSTVGEKNNDGAVRNDGFNFEADKTFDTSCHESDANVSRVDTKMSALLGSQGAN